MLWFTSRWQSISLTDCVCLYNWCGRHHILLNVDTLVQPTLHLIYLSHFIIITHLNFFVDRGISPSWKQEPKRANIWLSVVSRQKSSFFLFTNFLSVCSVELCGENSATMTSTKDYLASTFNHFLSLLFLPNHHHPFCNYSSKKLIDDFSPHFAQQFSIWKVNRRGKRLQIIFSISVQLNSHNHTHQYS